jgi:ubiquinone/menaquinone biosynthesis C-methylase UbiE
VTVMTTTLADQQRQQQKEMWAVSSVAWEHCDAWLERNMRPLATWLCEAAAIAPGHRVLDLASGTGHPATTIAARVGPTGRVIATDLSPEMVAVAKRAVARLGITNVEVMEMGAEQLAFPDAGFDAVTCRFGLMFCPEPARAAAEIHRVLRPGGRVALCVWDEPAKNPFFTAIGQLAGKFIPLPPPDPTAPGVFRLAAPGALESVLTGSGLRDVRVESMPMQVVYASPAEYWNIQRELAAPIRTAINTLPPDKVAELEAAVLALAVANTVDGEVRFTATPLCATASR